MFIYKLFFKNLIYGEKQKLTIFNFKGRGHNCLIVDEQSYCYLYPSFSIFGLPSTPSFDIS